MKGRRKGNPEGSSRYARHTAFAFADLTGFAVVVFILIGCAIAPGAPPPANPGTPPSSSANESDIDARDLDAIRGMAGVFDVTYTAVSTPIGGARPEAGGKLAQQEATAREAVLLVDESPRSLTLVHLLLIGEPPAVAKHWSQTWTPAPTDALRYEPRRGWLNETLRTGADASDTWRVRVADADGRPLFDAVGRFAHDGPGGAARWEQAAWAPRPADRRGGLAVGDDRTGWTAAITLRVGPGGWVATAQGQSGAGLAVVRTESYQRVEDGGVALTEAASAWWAERAVYWAQVRRWWDTRSHSGPFDLRDEVDGRPLWGAVFELADRVRRGEVGDTAAINEAIGAAVGPYLIER